MTFKNGHYVDSGLTLEKREELCKKSEAENNELKSWDEVPAVNEDQDCD